MRNDNAGNITPTEVGRLEGFAPDEHSLVLVSIASGPSVGGLGIGPQELVASMLDCMAVGERVLRFPFELGQAGFQLSDFLALDGE